MGVVVITGAGGGMGLACAAALAGDEPMVLVDIERARLDRAVAAAASAGVAVRGIQCDVAVPEQVADVVAAVRETGPLRAAVHTAGLSPSMADARRVLDVDLVGTAVVLEALFPLAEPGTAVVCIASEAPHLAPTAPELMTILDDPLRPAFLDDIAAAHKAASGEEMNSGLAYMLAKQGVLQIVERLAPPWGRKGARLCAISPGLIDTSMSRQEIASAASHQVMTRQIELTPLVRVPKPGQTSLPGTAEDIANAAAFLCSDRASFISGVNLTIDGGLLAAIRRS